MAMRLDKFLSHMGYGTRNEVKNIIKNGWVTIEGKTIKKAVNIPKWRSHLIRQNRATYSNLENHLIQITEPGNPI